MPAIAIVDKTPEGFMAYGRKGDPLFESPIMAGFATKEEYDKSAVIAQTANFFIVRSGDRLLSIDSHGRLSDTRPMIDNTKVKSVEYSLYDHLSRRCYFRVTMRADDDNVEREGIVSCDSDLKDFDRYMFEVLDNGQLNETTGDNRKRELDVDRLGDLRNAFVDMLLIVNAVTAAAFLYLDSASPLARALNIFFDATAVVLALEMAHRIFFRPTTVKSDRWLNTNGGALRWLRRLFYSRSGRELYFSEPRQFFVGDGCFWRRFDFVVTLLAFLSLLVSVYGVVGLRGVRLLRLLRNVRLLRMVSGFSQLRALCQAVWLSLPQITWMAMFLGVLMLFYGMLGVEIFGDTPRFESLHVALLTLFTLTTLEGWNGIMEEVLVLHPQCWVYFISYILIAAYIIMNFIVGIIVDGLQRANEKSRGPVRRSELDSDIEYLRNLTQRISELREREGGGGKQEGK